MYSPALDLTGYGKTLKEAKESLKISLGEYFRYAISNNTLEEDLKMHGWKRRSSEQKVIVSPSFVAIMRRNENLRNIVNEFAFQKKTYDLNVAIA